MMTPREFVDKLIDIEKNYKTVYGMGMPGMPITDANIREKVNQDKLKPANKRWWTPVREARVRGYIGKGYFGFDCICLAKAIGWGWIGTNARLGGAKYLSNGVPDWGANHTNKMGRDRTTDFSKIEVGHYVWMDGHIGFYIGNGLAIEASPKWKNGVQVTAVLNIGKKAGYNGRTWTTHGKLTWVDYSEGEKTMNYLDNTTTLYKGVKNDFVKQLQEDLIALGYDLSPHGADGSFGALTKTAVMQWQRDYSLEVDGRFGGGSRRKMKELKENKKVDPKPIDDTATVEYWRDMYSLQAGVVKELQAEVERMKNLAKEIIG